MCGIENKQVVKRTGTTSDKAEARNTLEQRRQSIAVIPLHLQSSPKLFRLHCTHLSACTHYHDTNTTLTTAGMTHQSSSSHRSTPELLPALGAYVLRSRSLCRCLASRRARFSATQHLLITTWRVFNVGTATATYASHVTLARVIFVCRNWRTLAWQWWFEGRKSTGFISGIILQLARFWMLALVLSPALATCSSQWIAVNDW